MKIGEQCPDFSALNQYGERINSHDYIGKRKTVIFFYPKDFTPGCTKEVCEFRDDYNEFSELNCEIVGISSDSRKSHLDFSKRYKLNYHLLSDSKNTIRKLFQVPRNLFGLIPGRVTYIIEKNGTIIGIYNSLSNSTSHISSALECLKKHKVV
jgi:peroxiredoxin Q/BCP